MAPPFIIAHRGNSAHRPENTFASFASALELGAELVECDVQLTADGHVVVMHDPTVDRTTNGSGDLRKMTLAQVRALSAGYPRQFGDAYPGERVPTLRELLGFLRDRAKLMIELKGDSVTDDAESGLEARTIAEVRRAGMLEHVAFLSFHRLALHRCVRLAPEVARGHLFYRGTIEDMIAGAREVSCDMIMPDAETVTPELMAAARAAGLRVGTWVVDDVALLQRMVALGLYGIASNRPGEMLEALAS